jgi:arginine exporter protein ArgO
MTAVSDLLIAYASPVELVGGILLIVFGGALLLGRPVTAAAPQGDDSRLWEHCGVIPQTFFLTVTNPGAILGMIAIVGGLGSLIGGLNNYLEALILVGAVMGGSLLWWIGLAELISTIRHKLTVERLTLINRIAGAVLFAFGVLLIGDGVWRQFS